MMRRIGHGRTDRRWPARFGRCAARLAPLLLTACGALAPAARESLTTATAAVFPTAPRATLEPTPALLPTPNPTRIANPSPTPCGFRTLPALASAWSEIELGCPIAAGVSGVGAAYVPFEDGQMLWRQDNGAIYVAYNNGHWERYDDLWRDGDPEYTCGEPSSPPTPVRGFGRVWCDHAAVRRALGTVTAYEIGDAASSAQDFVNGTLLLSPDGSTFVFVGETATWRRVFPGE